MWRYETATLYLFLSRVHGVLVFVVHYIVLMYWYSVLSWFVCKVAGSQYLYCVCLCEHNTYDGYSIDDVSCANATLCTSMAPQCILDKSTCDQSHGIHLHRVHTDSNLLLLDQRRFNSCRATHEIIASQGVILCLEHSRSTHYGI